MTGASRRLLARRMTIALWLTAGAIIVAALFAVSDWVQREMHELLPASTWFVVESVEPTSATISSADPLVFRIRGLRHRPYTERRTAVLSCNAHEGMLAGIWRQVGPVQRKPAQTMTPAVIGYADDEPVPESLIDAERLPGLEVWPGPLPQGAHDCAIAFRWPITTEAGADHVVTARSTVVTIGLEAPDSVTALDGTPEPPPAAPTPPAAELLEEVDEPADPPEIPTIEGSMAQRTHPDTIPEPATPPADSPLPRVDDTPD